MDGSEIQFESRRVPWTNEIAHKCDLLWFSWSAVCFPSLIMNSSQDMSSLRDKFVRRDQGGLTASFFLFLILPSFSPVHARFFHVSVRVVCPHLFWKSVVNWTINSNWNFILNFIISQIYILVIANLISHYPRSCICLFPVNWAQTYTCVFGFLYVLSHIKGERHKKLPSIMDILIILIIALKKQS